MKEKGIRFSWEDLEKEFGIKFKLENGAFRSVNEWLDDVYLKCSYQEAWRLIEAVMRNGDELFKDILTHKR